MTIIEEQAAEIERLETERDALRAELAAEREAHKKTHDTMNEIIIENTKLRAELAAAVEHVRNTDEACNRYAAERDALRELLREIRNELIYGLRSVKWDSVIAVLNALDDALNEEEK